MKRMRYVGNRASLAGQTAMVKPHPDSAGWVLYQVDDREHLHSYGWHESFSWEWEEIDE